MESISKILGILYLGVIIWVVSCGNTTQDVPPSSHFIPAGYTDSGLPDLQLSPSQHSAYYLDGQPFFPDINEGFLKEQNGMTQITLACHFRTEGFFFELNIPTGEEIEGSHLLSYEENFLIYSNRNGGEEKRYSTKNCPEVKGWVYIESFNEKTGSLRGHFEAYVCHQDSTEEVDGKWLRKGIIRGVKLSMVGE